MIRQRTLMLLMFSMLLAAGAVWIANNWLELRKAPLARAEGAETSVVVAAVDIPYGQKLERQHLSTVMLPTISVQGKVFNAPEDVQGKIALQPMLSGEIIRQERVVDHLEGSTLAAMIAPKMRAVTVRVDDVIGVAGFLLPGNRVDVLATKLDGKSADTQTILKSIKVLAVDQTASGEKNEPVVVRAVTLEMTPFQAETLVKARDEGRIQLALRNPLDEDVQEVAKAEPPKPVRRSAGPSLHYVTVIRGVTPTTTAIRM